jgi:hypothetical protein
MKAPGGIGQLGGANFDPNHHKIKEMNLVGLRRCNLEWVLLIFPTHPRGKTPPLLIGLSFSGMTFAKSLGASSDQISIQVPQGGDTKGDDTKDGEKKGDEAKMDDDKGDKGEGEDKDKK